MSYVDEEVNSTISVTVDKQYMTVSAIFLLPRMRSSYLFRGPSNDARRPS